jgi:hypothetical protein
VFRNHPPKPQIWGHRLRNTPVTRAKQRFAALLAAGVLAFPVMAADQPTVEDQRATRERAAAQPRIDSMNHVMRDEMRRILGELPDQPSPEVAKLMHPSASIADIGDTRVPLHLRIIEERRRQWVAAIEMAQYSVAGHCENPQPRPEQMLDTAWRTKTLQAIQCERDKRDRYQVGVHKLNKEHEANVLALHLPQSTQERALTEARASTARQDADLESEYAERRKSLRLFEEYVMFIDSHAARIHLIDGSIVFDDPADLQAVKELTDRIKGGLKLQQ